MKLGYNAAHELLQRLGMMDIDTNWVPSDYNRERPPAGICPHWKIYRQFLCRQAGWHWGKYGVY